MDRVLPRSLMGLGGAPARDITRGAMGQGGERIEPPNIGHVEAERDMKGAGPVAVARPEVARRIIVVADEAPRGKAVLVAPDHGGCEPLLEAVAPGQG